MTAACHGPGGAPCDAHAACDAQLVASELTTDAILHDGGVTGCHVDVVGRDVRVCVSDRSDALPVVRPATDRPGRFRTDGAVPGRRPRPADRVPPGP